MALTMQQEFSDGASKPNIVSELRRVRPLSVADEAEVLEFLSARPLHTVYLASLIRDNGIVSDLNRGCFFGWRSESEALEGVALIGHATIIESENTECIRAFAELAKHHTPAYLIRGEQQKIEVFWKYYTDGKHKARLLCGELLLRLKTIPTHTTAVSGLRLATIADLETIVKVNASMALDESGVNPLMRDPQGFRERAERRIDKGRIWVWIENERLLYKSDIVAETPQAIYLEGVYVHPEHRRQGYGLRCITQLAASLLEHTGAICLAVNEKSAGIQRFYKRAGYEVVCRYDSIYLDNSDTGHDPVALTNK
jgi:predicted GNAT family acetyltransferase